MGDEGLALLAVDDLFAGIAQEDAVIAAAQARRFAMLRELDRRPGCVPGARPGAEARTFLRGVRAANPEEDVPVRSAPG